MRYENVCVEAFAATFPEEIITTDELERQFGALYERLHLPPGRLELMTGIRERRLWPKGILPGDQSVRTVELLLDSTGIDRSLVGAFIHASVCRDYQEPATACAVHQRLHLPRQCVIFDISNACLGILTGMIQVANAIELGQIEAGIVVGTENSRPLLETTIRLLNEDTNITRQSVKAYFASLTIGSGSAAVLLTNRKRSRTGNLLRCGIVESNTDQSHLCRSAVDVSAGGKGDGQLMWTDSETLLHEGVATAKRGFERFQTELEWSPESIDRLFCHQVGKAHQKLLFEELGLVVERNFATLPYLGNTGSVALPTAAAVGMAAGYTQPGNRVALLGIGSGINVIMLGIDWNATLPACPSTEGLVEKIAALNV